MWNCKTFHRRNMLNIIWGFIFFTIPTFYMNRIGFAGILKEDDTQKTIRFKIQFRAIVCISFSGKVGFFLKVSFLHGALFLNIT